jgi:hypothetical protein
LYGFPNIATIEQDWVNSDRRSKSSDRLCPLSYYGRAHTVQNRLGDVDESVLKVARHFDHDTRTIRLSE